MAMAMPLVFLSVLSLLLCTSITVSGNAAVPPAQAPHHHHHHHHPPTPAPTHPPIKPPAHPPVKPPAHPPVKPPSHTPVKPPAHPPVKPPAHPPVKPPSHSPVKPPAQPPVTPPKYPPMRKKVAVQGVVFCKSCKFRGVDTLVGAAPLANATVKLECNNTKYRLREVKKTDKNGFFFFMPQGLTTSGSHKCKVTLVSSSLASCSVPTNLHGGAVGALLVPPKPSADAKPLPFQLFTVGPFAFEPAKKLPCHY